MNNEFRKVRIHKVLTAMEQAGLDLFILTPSPNLNYLTGFSSLPDERLMCLVLSPGHEPFILCNRLVAMQAEGRGVDDLVLWTDGENPYALLKDECRKRGIKTAKMAVENAMAGKFLLPIQAALTPDSVQLGGDLLLPLRLLKDEEERRCLIEAGKRADLGIEKVLSLGTELIGKTEKEIAAILAFELNKNGLSAGFSSIVAVGEHAAVPHHKVGDTNLEMGKCLLIDFGGTYDSYNADMTRTVHFGKPSDKFVEVYNIVKEANLLGEDRAKVGTPIEEVDKATRDFITKYGYGEQFIHRTGHGIGLEVHEDPYMVQGDKTLLAPGMAFSVEPGIYLPGEFGVRVEDIVLITEEGNKIMTSYPKDLIIFE